MKTEKDFDCVRMKDEIQAKLQAEYESRKGEFASYTDFIKAKANESEFIRQFKDRISGVKRAA